MALVLDLSDEGPAALSPRCLLNPSQCIPAPRVTWFDLTEPKRLIKPCLLHVSPRGCESTGGLLSVTNKSWRVGESMR